jgi:SmpA / OmlA family
MPHVSRAGAIVLVYLGASYGLSGQTPDTRLDDAVKEIALLKRITADQDRRVASLENAVRSQQRAILAAARPAPATISWRTLEGWSAVKVGMSRAQVVEILGEPKSTDIVIDRQTLLYKDGTTPIGQVVITDDRVSEVMSSRFQIYVPSQK